jgi:hypothetical protein
MSYRGKRRRTYRNNRKFYSLAALLNAQPAALTKDSRWRLLTDTFNSSDKLKRLRISSRCYRILNNASVPPENLKIFYRTYRLPESSFFPLFMAVKSSWFKEKEKRREEKEKRIFAIIRALDPEYRTALKHMAEIEIKINNSGYYPVWIKDVYPSTLKRANELLSFSEKQWQILWKDFFILLNRKYTLPGSRTIKLYSALFTLHLAAFSNYPLNKLPDKKTILNSFRRLSKKLHPDYGGDPAAFRQLINARKILIAYSENK